MCVDFLYDFRYNVAVTKVFKKHMHSIVVDTEQTAQECILYLRNHMLDRETFLPLNYIKYIPLKERLRNIQDPPNVKLLYDILSYPPEIEKAILLVTNNILVCDTMDQARWVAWVMEDRQNYDVVALDGTYFKKEGLFSGGTASLEREARVWDLSSLAARKEKLEEELQQARKRPRIEGELSVIKSKIDNITTKYKYLTIDKDSIKKMIEKLQQELATLKEELDNLTKEQTEIKNTIRLRASTMEGWKEKINVLEDAEFRDFCQTIGIANIREYEETDLKVQTEAYKQVQEYKKQISRIMEQLDFEKSRNTIDKVKRWEQNVKEGEEALERAKQLEQELVRGY